CCRGVRCRAPINGVKRAPVFSPESTVVTRAAAITLYRFKPAALPGEVSPCRQASTERPSQSAPTHVWMFEVTPAPAQPFDRSLLPHHMVLACEGADTTQAFWMRPVHLSWLGALVALCSPGSAVLAFVAAFYADPRGRWHVPEWRADLGSSMGL